MLYPIALCAALLFLAVTGLVQVGPSGTKPQAIESQAPAFRAYESVPDKPTVIDIRVTDASLHEIATWLSQNFELPQSTELPRVEFASPGRMHQLRYKGLLSDRMTEATRPAAQNGYQREVVAVYDDSTRTIYLPQGWTGATDSERSVLVHEMVHHLQNLAGLKYECGGAREKPAYLAQRKWLDLHGLDLEEEFEVDMFTIVALSACMN